jgi:hypothetical protein
MTSSDNPVNVEQLMSFEVSVTRHYGATDVTITLGGSFVVSSSSDTETVMDKLHYRVNAEHDRVQHKYAAKQNFSDNHNPMPSQGGATTSEWIPVSTLEPNSYDGKLCAKVRGGAFQKWGINVYPEIFATLPEHLQVTETKEYEPGELSALVQFHNGKPKRVMKLSHAPSEELE